MRNNATVISTATTTVCKTGAGLLHTITVTGGTAGTIVVYDNTAASGTILCKLLYECSCYIHFNVSFSIGLTVVTSVCYTRYCFRSLISQHYEPTNCYKSSQWWWSPFVENPQVDLSVDLTNSIIPQRGIGAVTYTRATIVPVYRQRVSYSSMYFWWGSFHRGEDVKIWHHIPKM